MDGIDEAIEVAAEATARHFRNLQIRLLEQSAVNEFWSLVVGDEPNTLALSHQPLGNVPNQRGLPRSEETTAKNQSCLVHDLLIINIVYRLFSTSARTVLLLIDGLEHILEEERRKAEEERIRMEKKAEEEKRKTEERMAKEQAAAEKEAEAARIKADKKAAALAAIAARETAKAEAAARAEKEKQAAAEAYEREHESNALYQMTNYTAVLFIWKKLQLKF